MQLSLPRSMYAKGQNCHPAAPEVQAQLIQCQTFSRSPFTAQRQARGIAATGQRWGPSSQCTASSGIVIFQCLCAKQICSAEKETVEMLMVPVWMHRSRPVRALKLNLRWCQGLVSPADPQPGPGDTSLQSPSEDGPKSPCQAEGLGSVCDPGRTESGSPEAVFRGQDLTRRMHEGDM